VENKKFRDCNGDMRIPHTKDEKYAGSAATFGPSEGVQRMSESDKNAPMAASCTIGGSQMRSLTWFRAFLAVVLITMSFTALVDLGRAQALGRELIVVSPKKMPTETRQPGIAMTLHLVGPQTLYLYVEEQNGRQVAVYDVSDPGRIKLKKIVQMGAQGAYDFIQSAGPSLELIRYRNDGRVAMLDLSEPKEPILKPIGSVAGRSYIVPRELANGSNVPSETAVDYEVFAPSSTKPLLTIKGILQQETDSGNGTTYLLGVDGLTEIRDINTERRLAASAPPWTNTIDDN
jgi:hypothetical protein